MDSRHYLKIFAHKASEFEVEFEFDIMSEVRYRRVSQNEANPEEEEMKKKEWNEREQRKRKTEDKKNDITSRCYL